MGWLDDVRKRCLDDCPRLLYELLPGGNVVKRHYRCANLSGGEGKSFDVNLKTGQWGDWADQQGPHGGDIISLWAETKGMNYKSALYELSEKYGMKPPPNRKKSEWKAIIPIPEDVYKTENGNPLLPDGILKLDSDRILVGTWPYFDSAGNLICFRVRINTPANNGKEFWTITYRRDSSTGETAWRFQAPPQPWTLYNLPFLSYPTKKILICEGEKVADCAMRLLPDWLVITWPSGSNNVDNADWAPVSRLRDVRIVLWPDNDIPGQQAMTRISEILSRPVEIVELDPRWPEKYDLANLEKDGWTTKQVESWISSHARTVTPAPITPRPFVLLCGKTTDKVKKIFSAISEIPTPELFYYGTEIVRMVNSSFGFEELTEMTPITLSAWCQMNLDLESTGKNGDGRVEGVITEGLSQALMLSAPQYLPRLQFIARTPIFSPDGHLIDKPGYQKDLQMWVVLPKDYKEPLPIEEALEVVDNWLIDFPFQTQADRANCLAFALSPILRPMIQGPVPMTRFEAPQAGTGKSLLAEIISTAITLQVKPAPLSENVEEIRKTILGTLLELPAIVMFDNANKVLGPALAGAITSRWWSDRKLGMSKTKTIPIWCSWAVTINNAQLSREFLRRTVRVRLDANMPNPEERRTFVHPNISDFTIKNRGIILAALTGICQYGLSHEGPEPQTVLGSFNSWSSILGRILSACGYEGFLKTIEEDRQQAGTSGDDAFEAFVSAWAERYGNFSVSTTELAVLASEIPDFPTHRQDDKKISSKSIGWVLRSHRGQSFPEGKIDGPHKGENGNYWVLVGAKKTQDEQNIEHKHTDPKEIELF